MISIFVIDVCPEHNYSHKDNQECNDSTECQPISIIATLTYVASMCVPWWYTRLDPSDEEMTNCFIDGTCRRGGKAFKDNGDAQAIYDWTLSLMIIAWLPYLTFVHLLLFRRSGRYEIKNRNWLAFSGILTFLIILVAVIMFGTNIYYKYGYHSLYGHSEVIYPERRTLYFGAHVGWYLAILTEVLLLPAISMGTFMKAKKPLFLSERAGAPLLSRTS